MSTSESFGMMSEAYFVGRYELLQWLNSFLKLNVRKVEECASGAIHCQIFDAIYPGKMPMNKLLQNLFVSVGINKIVSVERIVKARYQDNLELLQWVYEYFNRNFSGAEYNPIKRRNRSKGGKKKTGIIKGGKENEISKEKKKASTAQAMRPMRPATFKAQQEIIELNEVVRDLEKERDFYFSKILSVETLCKSRENIDEQESSLFVQNILDILYATEVDSQVVDPSFEDCTITSVQST